MANLNNFTVPIKGETATQGLLMPKLKFRFRGYFYGFGSGGTNTNTLEISKQIVTFARPQVTFDPVELPIYNSKAYVAGRPTWNPVSVTLRDDAAGGVSKAIAEQLQKQYDFYEQASAASGVDYKFQAAIELLDGGNGAVAPTVLESWNLYGCFLTDVNYNDLDYGSNDPVTITLSIRYDNALQDVTPTTALKTRTVKGSVTGGTGV
jgi:hypothetical protein